MDTWLPFLALLSLLTPLPCVTGDQLDCYTCVSTPQELTCVNDPDNVANGSPVTTCEKEGTVCCTIVRLEYVEKPGEIVSFARGCQDNCPSDGFSKVTDSSYDTYLTYCSTPRCNTGPGDEELSSSGGGGGGGDNNICCPPGQDSGAPSSLATSFTLVMVALLFFTAL